MTRFYEYNKYVIVIFLSARRSSNREIKLQKNVFLVANLGDLRGEGQVDFNLYRWVWRI